MRVVSHYAGWYVWSMLETVATTEESCEILGLAWFIMISTFYLWLEWADTIHTLGQTVGIQWGEGPYHMGIAYEMGSYPSYSFGDLGMLLDVNLGHWNRTTTWLEDNLCLIKLSWFVSCPTWVEPKWSHTTESKSMVNSALYNFSSMFDCCRNYLYMFQYVWLLNRSYIRLINGLKIRGCDQHWWIRSHQNSAVKRAWVRAMLRWVTSWEVFGKTFFLYTKMYLSHIG